MNLCAIIKQCGERMDHTTLCMYDYLLFKRSEYKAKITNCVGLMLWEMTITLNGPVFNYIMFRIKPLCTAITTANGQHIYSALIIMTALTLV